MRGAGPVQASETDDGTAAIDLIKVAVGESEVRLIEKWLQQTLEVLRVPSIVLIEKGDHLAVRKSSAVISRRRLPPVCLPEDTDRKWQRSRVDDRRRIVIRAIVHNNQLLWL